ARGARADDARDGVAERAAERGHSSRRRPGAAVPVEVGLPCPVPFRFRAAPGRGGAPADLGSAPRADLRVVLWRPDAGAPGGRGDELAGDGPADGVTGR